MESNESIVPVKETCEEEEGGEEEEEEMGEVRNDASEQVMRRLEVC